MNRKTIIRFAFILAIILLILSPVACASSRTFDFQNDRSLQNLLEKAPEYPPISFIVMSDLHVYDTTLGTTGSAFESYLLNDRKLLRESQEIFNAALASIIALRPGIVLITGDLTKDGERSGHDIVAANLSRLKAAGKKVYVIPGNHDINNPHAFRYEGSARQSVPTITADDFARIYSDYGFSDAIYRDTDSLSYVVEPVSGLWLLALDSCRYKENTGKDEPITDGRFSQATLAWIEQMLERAAKSGKAVIVMMHHGVMEHYKGQEKNYGEYIVDDFEDVGRLFAAYNVRLVFTGHYHAQDITVKKFPGNKFLFDIETGSLVTYPLPYRIIDIGADQQMSIRTEHVTSIPSHPADLPEYARNYLLEGITSIATRTIMKYNVEEKEASMLAKQVAEAFAAHYAGDENLTPGKEPIQQWGLSLPGWFVVQFRKDLVYGLWQDLPPPDNNISIDLKTGIWK